MSHTLAEMFALLVDDDAPVSLRADDGSTRERRGAVGVVEVRSPRALRYLATAPGELGLARAYVAGDLELAGDPVLDAVLDPHASLAQAGPRHGRRC